MGTKLVPRIVADERLSRANSALATVTLGLDVVFYALGGVFVAVFGATTPFLLDSATFAVAATLFARIAATTARDVDRSSGRPDGSLVASYLEGVAYGLLTPVYGVIEQFPRYYFHTNRDELAGG